MRWLRRSLQIVALVGTLIVGVLAAALIVSQTPWFRDWVRRYIVRESKQYLNGELAIGGLTGNLFFGLNLNDVAVDLSGQRVISVKTLELDYSFLDFISRGIILDDIKLLQPVVVLERDQNGWNLGRLVKKRRKEADREGPARPISLPSIQIDDATFSIRDALRPAAYRIPKQLTDVDIRASFEYEPVHYSIVLDRVSFRGVSPKVDLRELKGKIAVRDDNVYFEDIVLRLAETALTVDGVVEQYLKTPVVKLTTAGKISLPEVGRVLPALSGYALHPVVDIKANGQARKLNLDLNVRSEAGNAKGQLVADVLLPDLAFRGGLDVERLNLAPLVKNPAQRSNITGHANIDLRIASRPSNVRLTDRITGTYAFSGPYVSALGYEGRNVRASGRLDGPRITLDAARAAAYGGTATARGFIIPSAPGRPITYDLRGSVDNIDLRNLPASTGAPRLVSRISASSYHVRGRGRTASGTVTLNRSIVEGATFARGTVATFEVTPRVVSYSSTGEVAGLNIERMGRAFKITALSTPDYESRINAKYTVSGTVDRTTTARGRGRGISAFAIMTLDASGTLTDSDVWGGHVPNMAFETRIDHGAVSVRADGQFAGFNPARLTGRKELEGRVTGTMNASLTFTDVTKPIGPADFTAEGVVKLEESTIGGLAITSADVDGRYASQVGDLKRFTVTGPDLKVDAAGRLALDRTSQSNLKYHVEALDLAALAALVKQKDVAGAAILDGTLTGNAASLTTTGTLNGSNLSYQKHNALDVNSQYTVTIPELRYADAKVEAKTEATFLTIAGTEISELTATTTYENQRLDFAANIKEKTRELDATGQLIIHADHSEVHLPQLALRTQGVEWRIAPGSEATVRYGRGQLELQNVRLVSVDQALNVDGVLGLKGTTTSGTLRVQARNVDLQQLETLLLRDEGFSGRLNADATIAGTTADPIVSGRVEVLKGGFKTYRYESLIADVKYGGPRIQLDATLRQSPTETITARGSVPLTLFEKGDVGHIVGRGEDQIDLQVTSSQINLGIIQGFTDLVANVTGTMQADVHVSGSGRDPHLTGYIDIKDGAFGVPLGGVSYRGLNTRIDLTPDRVRLTKFTLLDEHDGTLTVSGDLGIHERQVDAVNVTLQSSDFELIDNQLGDVGVRADLRIRGELRRPRIDGEIRVEDGRLEVDQILQLFYDPYAVEAMPDVVSAERAAEAAGSAKEATDAALAKAERSAAPPGAAAAAAADAPPVPGGLFGAVTLDVRVRIPENLVLRGSDLRPGGPTGAVVGDMNITVGGDVRVRKDPGGPITLLGDVQTIRGAYKFQGRRFDLERGGQLRFLGTPQIDPSLDVTATRLIPTAGGDRNSGIEVKVRITGTARAPELALSSSPPLEESDILSLIVFNRQLNELGTSERSSLAATAGGIATGFLATPLGESIGRALDLDLFEITTSTEEGDLGAGITLGQQIGDRAFVRLRQQFGERNFSEFMVEYRLADFLRLKATAAPETTGSANRLNQRRIERAGIDLIFFFSY
jgi:autotransporter translocation and assembly factor TamB